MRKRNFFKAAHRDKAEAPIIKALRAVGAVVHQLNGKDIPDLLVGYRGLTYLLEVKSVLTNTRKDGYTRTERTAVSKGQQEFAASWRGGPVRLVTTPEEALMAIGAPVESELGPREVRALVMPPPEVQRQIEESQRTASVQLAGYRVTPAYQKAQTEAVVPKRRKAK